jgi:putative ABC transport system permease protein
VIILVILMAVGNAISMATRDRTREFGIMRTFGYQRAQIMGLVLSEGAVQALAGALLGTLAVQLVLAADIIKTVSAGGITISLSAGPSVWVAGIAAVFVAGVLGSVIPAWNVSRIAVVEAIRREE